MSSLSDERFESVLSGREALPEDLSGDAALAQRLRAHRAVKARLRGAFESVTADAAFVESLERRLAESRSVEASDVVPLEPPAVCRPGGRRFGWGYVAAAAAILLAVGISLSVPWPGGPTASAQEQLAAPHHEHESPQARLHREGDLARMSAYLKREVGFDPGRPNIGAEDTVTGCCKDRLLGRAVASYVLETPQGKVSLVVTPQPIEPMKLRHRRQVGRLTVWACMHGDCRMVAVRSGDASYLVVGDQSHEALTKILLRVTPGLGDRGRPT